MLWQCYTHYASKFGKLSRVHRTRKCQFSFQYQRRAMPKNVHTTTLPTHTIALISHANKVMLKMLQAFQMATHSNTLAWKIPWMEEPGGVQSMGSLRVRYDWATSLSFFTFMHWRRKWQPTPVFLPGESQGWDTLGSGGLVGCHLWSLTELDTTEVT